ncbi:MAG: family 43 glycosylhydrolase [Prevotellaceae bacterium]|jgi:hypothetical protein|nr:family 43 glycosylhydrolase [Prevotellaceae bacterium]
MKKKLLALMLVAGAATSALQAQNPIIRDQFTADPTARVFNGKVYLYPSHDIPSPIERLKGWFCMADYHVFSSENLMDWTDHGVIVTQNEVPWVQPNSYSMWAPDCVEKDGKYYFYFPSAPKGGRGFGVGVAIADDPAGPFVPQAEQMKGVTGIDPCVLVDKDGQAYIYWSGMGMQVAKLKPNMTEVDGDPVRITGMPRRGMTEGPFAFERDGKYYFTYPWVKDKTEVLAYAMGDSPMGPFTYQGVIMDESPTGCWTNHHSIVEYDGQWYLFYHHNDYSPNFDKNRSARVDSLFFNEDGTIKQVRPTLRGVGLADARAKIQLDRYSWKTPYGAYIDYLDPTNTFAGWQLTFNYPGTIVDYFAVDFGAEPVKTVKARVRSNGGGTLLVRTDGVGGPIVATLPVPTTNNAWLDVSAPMTASVTGRHDLRVEMADGQPVAVDWVQFD